MASFVPGLRRAAPRLLRNFFVCHQCLSRAVPTRSTSIAGKSAVLRSIRYKSTTSASSRASSTATTASPLPSLSQTAGSARRTTSRNFFPETSSKSVGYWLLGSAASVFGIVVFGGLTRLTESGYVVSNHYHALTKNTLAWALQNGNLLRALCRHCRMQTGCPNSINIALRQNSNCSIRTWTSMNSKRYTIWNGAIDFGDGLWACPSSFRLSTSWLDEKLQRTCLFAFLELQVWSVRKAQSVGGWWSRDWKMTFSHQEAILESLNTDSQPISAPHSYAT